MVKCSYCGENIPKGTGMMYVQKDAKVLYFCSRKCEKHNYKLGRKALNMKWTTKFVKGNK